jgi:hypothetical protein
MNRTVLAVGETIQLSLTFYGTQSVGVPSVPDIKGFNLRYVGPATRVSIINGKSIQFPSRIFLSHRHGTREIQYRTFFYGIQRRCL